MKKRWFVVILTIGLLLHVLPLSVLALSPDPITDADGTLLGWSDLSTVPYSLDDSPEQQLAVVDADNDEEAADDLPAGNPTPPPPKKLMTRDRVTMTLRMRTAMKQRMTGPQGIPPPKLLTRNRVAMTLRTRTAIKQQRMTCPQ